MTWLSKARGTFLIEVQGTDTNHKAFRRPISWHASHQRAMEALIDILKQWTAAHGAVQAGTKVSMIDTRDGGTVAFAQYLGFGEDTLFDGR